MIIGVIGLGTVGYGVVDILTKESKRLSKKIEQEVVVKYGCAMEERELPEGVIFTYNYQDVLQDPDVDVVVELIGGTTIAKKIIEEARRLANPNLYNAYQMVSSAYNDEMTSMNQKQSNIMENEMTLTRTKPEFGGYSEFDKNVDYLNELNRKDRMGMAGYTSLILIVTSAITFGMYLALKLLG